MDPRLFAAARSGDLTLLRQLFVQDPNLLRDATPHGNTALHLAVIFRHQEFSKELCSNISPSLLLAVNRNGDTPLLLAAAAGLHPIVTSFIMAAHFAGDAEEGRGGVKHGIMMMTNKTGNSALHEALRNKHSAVALKLLMAQPKLARLVNDNGESPLHMASNWGLEEVVLRLLLQSPTAPHVGPGGMTALHAAVVLEHSGIVKALLKERPALGKEGNEKGATPLHYASQYNKLGMVKLLLEFDASLAYLWDKDGRSPVMYAIGNNLVSIVEEIIRGCPESGLTVDAGGSNALHHSIKNGSLDVVEYILRTPELQGLINQPNNDGDVPLPLAAVQCDTKILRALLENKRLDMQAVNRKGYSATGSFYYRAKKDFGME